MGVESQERSYQRGGKYLSAKELKLREGNCVSKAASASNEAYTNAYSTLSIPM